MTIIVVVVLLRGPIGEDTCAKDVSCPKIFVRDRVVNTRQLDRSSFCHQMAILVIAASLRVVLTTEAKKRKKKSEVDTVFSLLQDGTDERE